MAGQLPAWDETTPIEEQPLPAWDETTAIDEPKRDWREAFNQPTAEASLSKEDWERANSFASGVVEGTTFSFADELAGILGMLPGGAGYKQTRDFVRGEIAEAQENHPRAALAGQVTGSLLTAAATGGAGLVRQGATVPARMGIAALEGGAIGGATAAGASEADLTEGETGQLAIDTATGAAVGAVLGPVAERAGALVGKGATAAAQKVRAVAGAVRDKAQKFLDAQLLVDYGVTAQALRRLPGLSRRAQSEYALNIVKAAEELGLRPPGVLRGRTTQAVERETRDQIDELRPLLEKTRTLIGEDQASKLPVTQSKGFEALDEEIEKLAKLPQTNQNELIKLNQIRDDIQHQFANSGDPDLGLQSIVEVERALNDLVYRANSTEASIQNNTLRDAAREIARGFREDEKGIIKSFFERYKGSMGFNAGSPDFVPLDSQPMWREVSDAVTQKFNGDATQISRKMHALIEMERWLGDAGGLDLSAQRMNDILSVLRSNVVTKSLGGAITEGSARAARAASGVTEATAKRLQAIAANPKTAAIRRALLMIQASEGTPEMVDAWNSYFSKLPESKDALKEIDAGEVLGNRR